MRAARLIHPCDRAATAPRSSTVLGRLASALALPMVVLAWTATSDAEVRPTLRLTHQVLTDRTLVQRGSYNYAPVVIHDGREFHMYWCGGVAGDFVLHRQAATLDGPWVSSSFWHADDVSLRPTGRAEDFDARHTCDPNVLKVGDRYYLYYTGEQVDGGLSAIGVAVGTDAVHFERIGADRPIVSPSETNRDWAAHHLSYGAGQPAAVYVAPYVYLAFTDSTGAGANPFNGAGQFVLRSRDPTFGGGVEELTAKGWAARAPGQHTAEHSVLQSFGIDLAYDALTNLLIAVSDSARDRTTVTLLEPDTFRTVATSDLELHWREGPGLAAEADKSLMPRPACDALTLQVFAAQGASDDPFSWHAIGTSAATFALSGACPAKP